MRRSNKEKTTGSKGLEPSMVQGLARCGGRGEQALPHRHQATATAVKGMGEQASSHP